MKKFKTGLACLLSLSLLTGCSSAGTLIKSYSSTALNTKNLIISTDSGDNYDFFAKNLSVFPKNTVSKPSAEEEKSEDSKKNDDAEEDENSRTETMDDSADTDETETIDSETDEDLSEDTDASDYDADEEIEIDSATGLLAGIDNLQAIYEKNIYDRVYPASLTKILTALIVLQMVNDNWNTVVTFTEEMVEDEWGAKLCGYEVGDQLTVQQLFEGLLVYSGNDAANALAIHFGGSIEAFSDLMNKKAKELGCVDTHFVNPSGLHDKDHYTSAYDMYLIFNECLKYDDFIDVIRQPRVDAVWRDAAGESVQTVFTTTNQYFTDVYDYPEGVRVLGGKTGTTNEAGSCLILYDVNDQGEGFISVILGAMDSDELYSEMNILLNKIAK